MTTRRLHATYLQTLTRHIFVAAGTPDHIAAVVAEVLVNANLTGHDSHGVLRIPSYLRAIDEGRVIPAAEPSVVGEMAATLLVDGRRGFGHYAARWAMARAIGKAQQGALCAVSLRSLTHIGRLGEYAEQAARAGCIGIVTTGGAEPDDRTIPYGGAQGALGTNPIAAGVPAGDGAPFLLDFATSAIAVGKIHVARSLGQALPDDSLVDRHGRPTVTPEDYYDGGRLRPAGRHKGYALSVLVALLGGLTGQFDLQHGAVAGGFMLVLDPGAFLPPSDYRLGTRAILDGLKAIPPAEGFSEVLTPGEPEQRARAQRLAEGIDIPEGIWRQIEECAQRRGVSL